MPTIVTVIFLIATAATPDLVTIPAGTYTVGCDACNPNKQPVRTVTLEAFQISATEVTVADYRSCVEDGGACVVPAPGAGGTYEAAGSNALPVNRVTWQQAQAFCAWAGQRLCTENEWEAAARGTSGALFPWGSEAPTCARVVADDRAECGAAGPAAVGSKPSGDNAQGVSDLVGNVAEWVDGCTAFIPVEGGDTVCSARVIRGGSAGTLIETASSTSRLTPPAYFVDRSVGFRCCAD